MQIHLSIFQASIAGRFFCLSLNYYLSTFFVVGHPLCYLIFAGGIFGALL